MEDKSMPPSYPGFDSQRPNENYISTGSQFPNPMQQQQYPYNPQQGYPQQQPGYPQGYPQPGFAQQAPVIVQTGSTPVIIGGGCPR